MGSTWYDTVFVCVHVRLSYWWSLLQSSHSLSHHSKLKSRDMRVQNSSYCDWARAQIRHKYMQFDTEKLQVVERMLEKPQ